MRKIFEISIQIKISIEIWQSVGTKTPGSKSLPGTKTQDFRTAVCFFVIALSVHTNYNSSFDFLFQKFRSSRTPKNVTKNLQFKPTYLVLYFSSILWKIISD